MDILYVNETEKIKTSEIAQFCHSNVYILNQYNK